MPVAETRRRGNLARYRKIRVNFAAQDKYDPLSLRHCQRPRPLDSAGPRALASVAPPHYFFVMATVKKDIEPEIDLVEEADEATLPEPEEESTDALALDAPGLAAGRAAIAALARHAPAAPGVYRMIDRAGEVLYVGKAKNIRKRIVAYTRPTGHDARIDRMIAATMHIEFVSTATETEALLLEANLIK